MRRNSESRSYLTVILALSALRFMLKGQGDGTIGTHRLIKNVRQWSGEIDGRKMVRTCWIASEGWRVKEGRAHRRGASNGR